MTTHANATMKKFAFPETVVADYSHWSVQLRPKQVTLGALVVICKSAATEFHRIGAAAFSELEIVTADVESALKDFSRYERINWLMLMMVDPDVHFHVLPRYSAPRDFAVVAFPDAGWPGPPDLKSGVDADTSTRAEIVAALKSIWKR
jgi:diadenosine tetraphosphate (Ap4A) HIT family hydrolase